MTDNLRDKTMSGMVWTFGKHFSLELFGLIQGIILARLLIPADITEKWESSIPLLQVLCFATFLWPIHILNQNILQITGHSGTYLKLEIAKKILVFLLLIATVPFGIFTMCLGQAVHSILCFLINIFYVKRVINVSYYIQTKDLIPAFFIPLELAVLHAVLF